MKEKFNIKIIRTILPILGLALLLLLSPCKVRNLIQVKLGIPQTEVPNKSKTTAGTTNCSTSDVSLSSVSVTTSDNHNLPLFSIKIFKLFFIANDDANKLVQFCETRDHSGSIIPLYILYQNFKDFL